MVNIERLDDIIKIDYWNMTLYVPPTDLSYTIKDNRINIFRNDKFKLSEELSDCKINNTTLTESNVDTLLQMLSF